MPKVCFSLDLEADHAGFAPEQYHAWQDSYLQELADFFTQRQVPLSIFVVGKTLEQFPKQIIQLQSKMTEFHLHSYSHNPSEPDSQYEITKGKKVFKDFFGENPKGYRAPVGRITSAGWQVLEQEGFLFDSSIIPSFWPHPRYLSYSRQPFWVSPDLLEIPFTTLSPARIPFELSWVKLLGAVFFDYWLHSQSLSDMLVFVFHLHDLWRLPAYKQLSMPWKVVYARNVASSFMILERIIHILKEKEYSFVKMTDMYQSLKHKTL